MISARPEDAGLFDLRYAHLHSTFLLKIECPKSIGITHRLLRRVVGITGAATFLLSLSFASSSADFALLGCPRAFSRREFFLHRLAQDYFLWDFLLICRIAFLWNRVAADDHRQPSDSQMFKNAGLSSGRTANTSWRRRWRSSWYPDAPACRCHPL